jgi:hypothetical protein
MNTEITTTPTNETTTQPTVVTMEEAKRTYFLHPIAKQVFDEIELQLECANNVDRKMLIVTGPPGVGKTTIAKMLQNQILNTEKEEMEHDPEYLPVVVVSVDESPEKKSKWKTLFGNVLEAFGDVLIDKKTGPMEGKRSNGQVSDNKSTDSRRRAVENQIRRRRTKVIIIDECQHLLVEGRYPVQRNLNMLKSLCTKLGIKLVLIGPYELVRLINLDGQLIRRSNVIHFRAFNGSKVETNQFLATVNKIKRKLPLEVDPLPEEFLIMSTLRSVGLAKELFLVATQRALSAGKSSVSYEDMQVSALTAEKLQIICEEQKAGERLFLPEQASVDFLRKELGLPPLEKTPPRRGSSRALPGTRLPHRDALGYGAK